MRKTILILIILLSAGINLPAQSVPERIVEGKITDGVTGLPVSGSRIGIPGTAFLVLADETGSFKLKVASGTETVEITAPGYAVREISLKEKKYLEIRIYSNLFTSTYGETASFSGKQRKSLLAYSEKETKDWDFVSEISLEPHLQARLGGDIRTVTRSGFPDVGASMFIRGLNSLNAKAQPLIIVDGVIWDRPLNTTSVHEGFFSNPLSIIDPNDIESITVVKDGSTIYGSKASGGVLLINTARGKDMTTRITARIMQGMSDIPSLPSMMDASQYKIYASDQVQGLKSPQYGWTDKRIAELPFLTEDQGKSYYGLYHNDTRWSDAVYRRGHTQSYGINVNGGDAIALYNLSVGYTTAQGTVKNTDMQRLNARFNSDVNLSKRLFAKVDLSISQLFRDLRDDGIDPISSPGYISLIKAPILSPYRVTKIDKTTSSRLSDYDAIDPYNMVSNPVALVENAMGMSSGFNFNLIFNPRYVISNNLTAGAVLGYRIDRQKEAFFIPQMGTAPHRISQFGNWVNNEVRDLSQIQTSFFSDVHLDWNFKLSESRFTLTGGYRFLSDSFESDLPRGYNTGNDNVKILVSNLTQRSVSGVNEAWKSLSWYGIAAYNYKGKYLLEASGSMDASSRFGKKTKSGLHFFSQSWAVFPAISGAWVISAEDFMAGAEMVNFLKLRAGYGLTGNDDIDIFTSRSYFNSVNYTQDQVGLILGNIQNETIQWEISAKANAGLDISLLDDRLSFSADVFDSRTSNLLTQKQLKSFTGLDYYWSNGGELKNQGFEFSLNTRLVNSRTLKWELGASIGHYKNRIVALPDGDYTTGIMGGSVLTAVGHPAGVFYGYKTAGVFATTAEAEAANISKVNANGTLTPFGAGDVHFLEVLKDGRIDMNKNDDKQIIGDPNPDFYGTVSNRFRVKNLTLDALFTYSYGNDAYNYLRYMLESGSGMYNQTTAMLNRWTAEGRVTSIPRAVYGDPMGNSVFSDRWIEDASYFRLKTLTLSYYLPLKLPYLPGITLWASANNLFTLTKYLGGDPEFSFNNSVLYQGIDAGLTPQGRSYFLGLKINL